MKAFSPTSSGLFSNLVVCLAVDSEKDTEVLWAYLTFNGAKGSHAKIFVLVERRGGGLQWIASQNVSEILYLEQMALS